MSGVSTIQRNRKKYGKRRVVVTPGGMICCYQSSLRAAVKDRNMKAEGRDAYVCHRSKIEEGVCVGRELGDSIYFNLINCGNMGQIIASRKKAEKKFRKSRVGEIQFCMTQPTEGFRTDVRGNHFATSSASVYGRK